MEKFTANAVAQNTEIINTFGKWSYLEDAIHYCAARYTLKTDCSEEYVVIEKLQGKEVVDEFAALLYKDSSGKVVVLTNNVEIDEFLEDL